jgi:Smr domain
MPCRVINLEEGRPTVNVGLLRLDHALTEARADGVRLLKLIHGYGSSGAGGRLREEVWKALDQMQRSSRIAAFIPGEEFRESNETSWELVKRNKALREDHDYGRGNRGITIVVL